MKIKNLPKLLSIMVTAASTYIVAGEQEEVRGSHSGSHHFEGKVCAGRNAYDMHDIKDAKGNAFVQGDHNYVKPNYKPKKDKSWKDQSTHVSTNVKAKLF